jgi:hypothetical protein
MRHTFPTLPTAVVTILLFVGTGCSSGLNSVMRQYGYTAMNPPDTAWEPGTPVRIAGGAANPDPLLLPSMVKPNAVAVQTTTGAAPQVSQSHNAKLSLGAGVTVPQGLATKIEASYSNVRQYSVVSSGNQIVTVPLLPYVASFNAMKAYGDSLQPGQQTGAFRRFADDGTGYWLRRLWLANKLEYKFYDENGATVTLDVTKLNLSANADWKVTNEGSLTYDAAGGKPICIGYIAEAFRPVPKTANDVDPFGTGGVPAGTVLPISLDGLVPLSDRVLIMKSEQ